MSTNKRNRMITAAWMALLLVAAGLPAMAALPAAHAQSDTASTPSTQAEIARNMQTMRAQMMQLRATQDPAKRSRLLQEHMHSMQTTLHMMMGPGGMGNRAGMGRPGNMQGNSGMKGNAGMGPGMMSGGGMMGNGRMMQMMMGQMMQHQQAMQSMGCASATGK